MTSGAAPPAPGQLGAGTRFTDVRWVPEIDSTNRVLLEEAAAGAPEGRVLATDHQTAGRGRRGRTWTAPPGSSLLVSILLRPALPADRLHLVTVAVGLAAADACAEVAGVDVRLKWPNDLVVAGGDGTDRKLAGILAESLAGGPDADPAVVVGLGCNVNWPVPLPDELAATATALGAAAGAPVDRAALLGAVLRHLELRYAPLARGGQAGRGPAAAEAAAEALRLAWAARSATLGRAVKVELPHGELLGTAVDLTPDGHLLVAPERGGEPRAVAVGDVVHLRPVGA